ncbi:MAG: exosome complex RNA-binding protein Csl4 [Candidatus Diapherotrites archaeon]|nr:exosome complex RNA-binding protein Csl4 [Candidatus Diapherotrites archaeon]
MTEQPKLLFPGDFIANEEVFLPGQGAFSDDGRVKAAVIGVPLEDMKKREVKVTTSVSTPAQHSRGDVVIGSVEKAFENVAFIKLAPLVHGKHRYNSAGIPTTLRISEIKQGYVKSLDDELKPGDIIRARVIDASQNGISLSTKGKHYGVIKAFCSRCRHPLELKEGVLECPQCGWKERRKITDDYRSGRLLR